jgi:hypothetical protein
MWVNHSRFDFRARQDYYLLMIHHGIHIIAASAKVHCAGFFSLPFESERLQLYG